MGHMDEEGPPKPEIAQWRTLTVREAWKMPEDELRDAASAIILNYYIQTGVDPLPGLNPRKLPRHDLMKIITEHPEWFAEQPPVTSETLGIWRLGEGVGRLEGSLDDLREPEEAHPAANQYTMYIIRSEEGICRDYDGWDFGLVNFGYIECERVPPIPLRAIDRESAKLEAFRLWHEWCLAPADSEPEGYWIGAPDGTWFDMHLGDELAMS